MLIKTLFQKLTETKWNIGFVDNTIDGILSGEKLNVRWLKHNFKDRWFADPFIFEINDKNIIVLVEEFYYPINRGRVAKLTIDKKSLRLISTETVLELSTHLSFPAFVNKNGIIYLYPENSESGQLYLYKINKGSCEKIKSICDRPLTDAIYTEAFGFPTILSTCIPDPNGKVLGIYDYQKDNKTICLKNKIEFNERIARNAGNIFVHKDRIYRPAQESNKNYGHAISLQEVILQNDTIIFNEIRRMTSPHRTYNLAFHTFNVFDNYIVVDCLGYRYGIIGRLLRQVRDIFPVPELK